MWRHLQEDKANDDESSMLPKSRYYKVVVWIAAHAFIDIIALICYSVSVLNVFNDEAKNFYGYLSTTLVAFHVAFYPVVYCGVRDLKFHDQVHERLSTSSRVKDAVKRLFGKSEQDDSFKSIPESPQAPHLNTQQMSQIPSFSLNIVSSQEISQISPRSMVLNSVERSRLYPPTSMAVIQLEVSKEEPE